MPRLMTPLQAAKILANGLAADLFFRDPHANLQPHLHLEKKDLEGVVATRDV